MDPVKLCERIPKLVELPPFVPGGNGLASTEPNHAEARARLILLALQAIPLLIKLAPTLRFTIYESHPQELCSDGKGAVRIRRMGTDTNDITLYMPLRAAHNTRMFLEENVALRNFVYGVGLAVAGSTPLAEEFVIVALKDFEARVASHVPRHVYHLVQMGVLPADYMKMWISEWNRQWWPIPAAALTMDRMREEMTTAKKDGIEKAERELRAVAALRRMGKAP